MVKPSKLFEANTNSVLDRPANEGIMDDTQNSVKKWNPQTITLTLHVIFFVSSCRMQGMQLFNLSSICSLEKSRGLAGRILARVPFLPLRLSAPKSLVPGS